MQGCQTHFHWGHISLEVAFKGPNVISTPSQLRSSYIYTVVKLFQPFEGHREADVAPGENEFDSPDLADANYKVTLNCKHLALPSHKTYLRYAGTRGWRVVRVTES